MSLNEVRWGIIGCGDVTEVKSGPAFQKVQHSQLVAVMRRTSHLAQDYAARHKVAKWYDDADALIHDADVNAVYIATPPGSHKEYTLKAAKASKHVYVEKPMALNWEECQEMIEACQKANVSLYVAYYRRAQPRFLKVKELLDNRAIGEVRFVKTTHYRQVDQDLLDPNNLPWRVQPHLSGGGLFFDLASHTLDILDFLLGPIKQAKGFHSNQEGLYAAEDIVTGTYMFQSGVQGVGSWCFSAFDHVDSNEIIGSHGKISFSTFGDDPILLTTANGQEQWLFERPQHVHQPLVEKIVADLTSGSSLCPSTGQSGARTNWVMDQLMK